MAHAVINVKEMVQALIAQGFSESTIAYGTKVNRSTISRIVTGKTHSPRYQLANSVEEIFLKYGSK